jgi:hypothetical protein
MKDIPIIEPKEVITTITNIKTGEEYYLEKRNKIANYGNFKITDGKTT